MIAFCAFVGIWQGNYWWGVPFGDWFWQRWLFGLVMIFIPSVILWLKSAQIALNDNSQFLGAAAKASILLSSIGLLSGTLDVLGRSNWWPTYPIVVFLIYVLAASILALRTPQAAKDAKK